MLARTYSNSKKECFAHFLHEKRQRERATKPSREPPFFEKTTKT